MSRKVQATGHLLAVIWTIYLNRVSSDIAVLHEVSWLPKPSNIVSNLLPYRRISIGPPHAH